MLPEVLESIVKNEGLRDDSSDKHDDRDETGEGALKYSDNQKVVETHHARLVEATRLVNLGLSHSLLALELITPKHLDKQQKTQACGAQARDDEARGETLSPLQDDFASPFERELHAHYSRRKRLPESLRLLRHFWPLALSSTLRNQHRECWWLTLTRGRRFFSLILYMGHLQDELLNAGLQLVQIADSKVADGTMKCGLLIFPKQESLRAWFYGHIPKQSTVCRAGRCCLFCLHWIVSRQYPFFLILSAVCNLKQFQVFICSSLVA